MEEIKEVIAELILNQLKHTALKKENILNVIEIPPSPELGDYAFPCFILAKEMKKSPVDIATGLATEIKPGKAHKDISGIKAAGPYLNFFLDKKIMVESAVNKILKEKEKFGCCNEKGRILIEHTSVNPNASPHVGRARNSIIGDSIKRILEFSGFETEVHYYVNDVSKQIAMMSLNCTGREKFSELLKKYQEIADKVSKSPELEKKVFAVLNKFESGDKATIAKIRRIVSIAIAGQKKILLDFGIKFDRFDYESSYLKGSYEILKRLEKTGRLFTDDDGRKVLNQEGTGVERGMKSPVLVLTRNDGTGLYPLRDLAYTIDKLDKSEKNIIVLGEDHKLYFQQVSAALKLLGYGSPQAVHYSFVLIQDAGKAKKMSTRKGDIVLLEDFMKEAEEKAEKEIKSRKTKGDAKKIGYGAVKYALLKNSADKNIIFNWQDALSFEGDTGPYLQYSYARASSILKKAKISESRIKSIKISSLESHEIELARKLNQFPAVIEGACRQLNPSSIANYSFELAKLFNEFYHACPVIHSSKEVQNQRLALVQSFRIVMKNALWLLGMDAIEEM
ncbi:MAG TPA: arginine--tRNA ligase [Candidatus Nanoarchaeia archaeon]|nr:arginine--tRNA ligase [Candidatus Nanoarchaeia archaeon]